MTKARVWRNIYTSLAVVGTCQLQMQPWESGTSLKRNCLKVLAPRQCRKNENDHLANYFFCISTWNADDTRVKLNRYSYHLIKQGKCPGCEHHHYAMLMRFSLKPCQASLLPTHAIQDRHWVQGRLQFSSRKCYKIQEILISATPTATLSLLLFGP